MDTALIGLVGIVVGGAIALFAQQLRPNARNVRAAARLLRGELDLTLAYTKKVLDARSWQPEGRALSVELWTDRRSLLAAELGEEDWKVVAAAYDAIEEIRATKRPRSRLWEEEVEKLDEARGKITQAREVLGKLSGQLPTITQSLRRRRRG
jgi:hypothetical protein